MIYVKKFIILFITLCFLFLPLLSDDDRGLPRFLDLSKKPMMYIEYVPTGKIPKIVLGNIHCEKEYNITYEKINNTIHPFDISPQLPKALKTECVKLSDEITKFKDLKDNFYHIEAEIPKIITNLEGYINACNDENLINAAKNIIIKNEKEIIKSLQIEEGDEITIKVKRDKHEWIFILREQSLALKGKWLISYGFSYIVPVDKPFIKKDLRDRYSNFIVDSNKVEEGYCFLRDDDKSISEIVPSIFFSWLSTKRAVGLNIGPAAGLSIDLKKPSVFLGACFTYSSNIMLNIGWVLHKRTRLKDKYYQMYINGQKLNEILDHDALHDYVYKPGFFISLSFRFKSNPFKVESEKKSIKEEEKPSSSNEAINKKKNNKK